MLVIRVEIWPNGDARKAKILGTGTIINDISGNKEIGNYDVAFHTEEKGLVKVGRVENYPRLKGDIWSILKVALTKSKKAKTFMDSMYAALEP